MQCKALKHISVWPMRHHPGLHSSLFLDEILIGDDSYMDLLLQVTHLAVPLGPVWLDFETGNGHAIFPSLITSSASFP